MFLSSDVHAFQILQTHKQLLMLHMNFSLQFWSDHKFYDHNHKLFGEFMPLSTETLLSHKEELG